MWLKSMDVLFRKTKELLPNIFDVLDKAIDPVAGEIGVIVKDDRKNLMHGLIEATKVEEDDVVLEVETENDSCELKASESVLKTELQLSENLIVTEQDPVESEVSQEICETKEDRDLDTKDAVETKPPGWSSVCRDETAMEEAAAASLYLGETKTTASANTLRTASSSQSGSYDVNKGLFMCPKCLREGRANTGLIDIAAVNCGIFIHGSYNRKSRRSGQIDPHTSPTEIKALLSRSHISPNCGAQLKFDGETFIETDGLQ